jgi:hypothetical protein
LVGWLYPPIARAAGLRRQIARLGDPGMASIDADVFASILCEQCPDLELCCIIGADPTKLAVESTGAGWLLLLRLDGEATPITLQRFEAVVSFWKGFTRRYLGDQAAMRRAA